MNTSEKLVALTFDDGPTATATERVLSVLAEHEVPAIFFMIGKQLEENPTVARQVIQAGHSVGIHSYRHKWLLPFHTKRAIAQDLNRTRQVLEKLTPKAVQRPKYYRPPHGWRTPWMLRAIRENGYKPVLWDVITQDFRESFQSEKITNSILRRAKPGSIIVLHDGVAEVPKAMRNNMVEALPAVITGLKKKGYRFVALQDLIN